MIKKTIFWFLYIIWFLFVIAICTTGMWDPLILIIVIFFALVLPLSIYFLIFRKKTSSDIIFCQRCGEKLWIDAKFCSKCGASTLESIVKSTKDSSKPGVAIKESGAVWNPNIATGWSIIFTVAFGSYIHALNWRTLDQQDRAKSAMVWFYISLAILILSIFIMEIPIAYGKEEQPVVYSLLFVYLLIWYFSAGRSQAKYIKEKLGSDYPRRSWDKPLLIGLMAFVNYLIIVGIFEIIIKTFRLQF